MIIPKSTNPNHDHFKRQAHDLIDGLNPDIAWKVTAVRSVKKRSNPQNSAYWGIVMKMISEHTGHDVNDLHEFMLGECFGWDEYEIMGKKKVRPHRTSSQLNTEEFNEYYQWCQQFAATNLGIIIPDPGEPVY